jgi:hypothetical protein
MTTKFYGSNSTINTWVIIRWPPNFSEAELKILSFTWVHTIVLLHFWTPTTTCVFYTEHISDTGPVSISSEKAEKYNKILGWQTCQVIQVIKCFSRLTSSLSRLHTCMMLELHRSNRDIVTLQKPQQRWGFMLSHAWQPITDNLKHITQSSNETHAAAFSLHSLIHWLASSKVSQPCMATHCGNAWCSVIHNIQ